MARDLLPQCCGHAPGLGQKTYEGGRMCAGDCMGLPACIWANWALQAGDNIHNSVK
jgi:hypothetical protein